MIGTLIQMVAATAAVIALIYGVAYMAKKKQKMAGDMLEVVGYKSFGPKRGVAAMKVGADVLILGVTPNDFRLLASYKADDLMVNRAVETEGIPEKIQKLRMMKEELN